MTTAGGDQHCGQIFWNAIELIHRPGDVDVLSLLHNIGQTARCDKVRDLSTLRDRYRQKMGPAVYDRVVDIDAQLTQDELRRAQVTVGYYIRWTRQEFVSALPLTDWAYYQVVYRPLGQIVAALGITTALWKGSRAGYRAGISYYNSWRGPPSAPPPAVYGQ